MILFLSVETRRYFPSGLRLSSIAVKLTCSSLFDCVLSKVVTLCEQIERKKAKPTNVHVDKLLLESFSVEVVKVVILSNGNNKVLRVVCECHSLNGGRERKVLDLLELSVLSKL
jgi:hypothetical protein